MSAVHHSLPATLPNTYLRQFFRYLGSHPQLLTGTEQTPKSLAQLDGRNSFHDYCRFFINARNLLKEPTIGLMLGQVNQLANMHGPLSAAIFHCTDISDSLNLMCRFIPLRSSAFKTDRYEDNDNTGVEIQLKEDTGEAHVLVSEALLLALTNLITVASQQQVKPSRIELDYPRPAYADRYPEAFQAASFRFSCDKLRLLVSRKDARIQTGTDVDPNIRNSVIERCEELLQGVLGEPSTSERLRQIFSDNPGHLWTLHDLAKHLSTSESTLQRRLAAEGTSYRKLHEGWLQGEANKLLAEEKLSVESIALLLGYSDVSNFRSACRRWFGKPPSHYREELLKTHETFNNR